jgi:poly(A) polymerase
MGVVADWIRHPATQAVTTAFPKGTVRFVGGCVRDTLLGRAIKDIDLATPLRPEEVAEHMRAAGIKVIPTGLQHGTITAVAHDERFEITTLRVDVETDGRHARVEFTDDWVADAARRDFTMNAISMDPDGTIHDPFRGEADAKAGRVCFVNDPDQRIAEDYLRLLRFFRFHAHYGQGDPDPKALDACARHAPNLATLSGERVCAEVLKLLAAQDPMPALTAMIEHGIWNHAIPGAPSPAFLRGLVQAEQIAKNPDPIRRLAAVAHHHAEAVADRLKLSRQQAEQIDALDRDFAPINPRLPESDLLRVLHREGGQRTTDKIMLGWADSIAVRAREIEDQAWLALVNRARAWVAPKLPVNGDDMIALGIKGKRIGEIMDDVRTWWIDNEHRPDRDACLERIRALASGGVPFQEGDPVHARLPGARRRDRG